jgi:hypothetical protein
MFRHFWLFSSRASASIWLMSNISLAFGQQPRFDFGIRGLKTIVEVKIARSSGDFSRIEEEVAGDLGLYFTDIQNWNRMVVYIYDDSNVLTRSATIHCDRRFWCAISGSGTSSLYSVPA